MTAGTKGVGDEGTEADPARHEGGCLCGAVRYVVRGALRPVVNCHCGQCRRFHGHHGAYSGAARGNVTFTSDTGLRWYRSSPLARRGFCGICGASMFYDRDGRDLLAIAAGSLDRPTGLKTVRHIFTADRGDYYEISDGLEQLPGSMLTAQAPSGAAG
jgi:hypothetical protein